ncbi:GntR family transcriptional regulator [Verrucomicrobium spinosum]|uniref:GntR family transcriptional regulator n=1 Tax=Verrucomicrobium spinosum TaxID=2736 RepID=UPI0018DE7C54|nr:GntR family transcriptional regulator [Verrucomicrobium spinosum]
MKISKHRQIHDTLRLEILHGKYQPGQKIPSEAALVTRFGASRITVGRAVRDLHRSGLVERRAGSGTYVRLPPAEMGVPEQGLTFGLLIPDRGRTEIFEPMCQGMAESPQALGHALLWSSSLSRDPSLSRAAQAWEICQSYLGRRVSGVFFAPLEAAYDEDQTNHRIVTALDQAGITVVLLDRDFLPYPKRSRHDLVGIDNRRTGFAATQHLVELGCRHIAFVTYPEPAATIDERIAGYREALYTNSLPVVQAHVQRLAPDSQEQVQTLLHSATPDGIVCANDRTAGQLMHSLMQLGHRVPQDIRIVGIDDIAYASLLPVPLTTLHQPAREIGQAAMSAMLDRLARPDMPVRDILLECPLIVRKSCGGLNA